MQGALFGAPDLEVQQSHFNGDQTGGPTFVVRRFERAPNDCFVVVSQTCDIRGALEDEPSVEALLCRVESKDNRGAIGNSARYFEVDSVAGLVAVAGRRVVISKRTLWAFDPIPWPASQERLKDFSNWLGRRFSRPALPEEIVQGFQQSMERELKRIRKKNEACFARFNGDVRQIRIGYDAHSGPPYELEVNLLTTAEAATAEEADAIEEVMRLVYDKNQASLVRLSPYIVRRPDMWSTADYLDTVPVFLDYLTLRGGEIVGAAPPPSN